MEANLCFQDKNIFSQCSYITKQGIYLQVDYQGIVQRWFPIDSSSILYTGLDQICYLFFGTPGIIKYLQIPPDKDNSNVYGLFKNHLPLTMHLIFNFYADDVTIKILECFIMKFVVIQEPSHENKHLTIFLHF